MKYRTIIYNEASVKMAHQYISHVHIAAREACSQRTVSVACHRKCLARQEQVSSAKGTLKRRNRDIVLLSYSAKT